ncbi:two pore domain potassium channel family protein [Bradyrhizobium sp. BRP14]|nr:two pore domain potassium channel family protein [Bradyrhizobium sp. BRP14]
MTGGWQRCQELVQGDVSAVEVRVLFRLALACSLIAATVAIQAVFMSAGLNVFRRMEKNRRGVLERYPTFVTVAWVTYLILPIAIDIALWAALYYIAQALTSLEDALYFSTVTFTTVGYGDIVLGKDWRQVATFEAINGWIIFGWATALMMAVIQRLYFREAEPRGKG